MWINPGNGRQYVHKSQVKTLEGKLTYNAEGNDISSSLYDSRVIHWTGNDLSGVIPGRGYDMGGRTENDVYNDMIASGIPNPQAVKISKCAGLKGVAARDHVSTVHSAYINDESLKQALVNNIKTSQRDWIKFRDSDCKLYSFQIDNKSPAYQTTVNQCVAKMSETRGEELAELSGNM
ncbi:DUF1311 domain-containing protein [Tatumella sp. JGM130]|uniref:lysozyme inhibitor LprI family protein n=1 Tax=Tatumella sp. JGM130 TaxID=2799797 RepID=UPI001BB016BA|nr:lysozyme inhibitor LprI family protein [Tatumella sp. JGM130]MBS0892732.1 DUF1311 domain-containing protein [Tatumella sp. JGM130]